MTGSHAKLTPDALAVLALHPSLQDQDGSHPVDGLTSLLNREIGLPQEPIGLGCGEALVPEMDRQLEVLAEIVGKRLNLLGSDAFGSRHPGGGTKPDFGDAVL